MALIGANVCALALPLVEWTLTLPGLAITSEVIKGELHIHLSMISLWWLPLLLGTMSVLAWCLRVLLSACLDRAANWLVERLAAKLHSKLFGNDNSGSEIDAAVKSRVLRRFVGRVSSHGEKLHLGPCSHLQRGGACHAGNGEASMMADFQQLKSYQVCQLCLQQKEWSAVC